MRVPDRSNPFRACHLPTSGVVNLPLLLLVWYLSSPVVAAASITLPIEVLGPDQTVESVPVEVPTDRRVTSMWMEIHGLTMPDKASVRVNEGSWVPLNNKTVTVEQPGRSFGGIGGGFATLRMSLKLPRGLVKEGSNTVQFRFNDVTRNSIGFRVLRFNFIADGRKIIPDSAFTEDDPRHWKAPLEGPEAVSAGRRIWYESPLVDRGKSIQARCTDCHAHDGRDLKYFNYSNHSIIERSRFHGLSEREGKEIASFIRSLPVPYVTNGRPWNPPYQPGPGLDSRPVHEWTAGAGLKWVLDRDADTFNYIFPNGITSEAINFKGSLNAREIPVAIQYPDWNHWLPEVHPKDAWGEAFTRSEFGRKYSRIRDAMSENKVASAKSFKELTQAWYQDTADFFGRGNQPGVPIPKKPWSREFQVLYNASAHWHITKEWEIITEFGLEEMGKEVLGPHANARTWYDGMIFNTAPHLLKLEWHTNPINDGSLNNWNYFSAAWYQLQVTLNNSNKRPYGTGPIDWPYLHAFTGTLASKDVGSAAILTLNLVTAAQSLDNGKGPRAWNRGWDPTYRANAYLLVPEPHWPNVWKQVPLAKRRAIVEAYLKNWIDRAASYPAQDYYVSDEKGMSGAFAKPGERFDPQTLNPMGGRWLDRYWPLVANAQKVGVDPELINRMVEFGGQVWPAAPWKTFHADRPSKDATRSKSTDSSAAKDPRKSAEHAALGDEGTSRRSDEVARKGTQAEARSP